MEANRASLGDGDGGSRSDPALGYSRSITHKTSEPEKATLPTAGSTSPTRFRHPSTLRPETHAMPASVYLPSVIVEPARHAPVDWMLGAH